MDIREKNKLLEFIDCEIGGLTKLNIISHANSCDVFLEYTDEQKEKIVDFIYNFWEENGFVEYTLYDVVYTILNCANITTQIDLLEYKEFENIIEDEL